MLKRLFVVLGGALLLIGGVQALANDSAGVPLPDTTNAWERFWYNRETARTRYHLSHPVDSLTNKVATNPVERFLVLPIYEPEAVKVYHDLPMVFAGELATLLSQRQPESRIYGPYQAIETLERMGAMPAYEALVKEFSIGRRVSPQRLALVLQNLSEAKIDRVILIEANADMSHLTRPASVLKPSGIIDRIKRWTFDNPTPMRVHITARLTALDTAALDTARPSPDTPLPILMSVPWQNSFPAEDTPYLISDITSHSGTQSHFLTLGRQMSQTLLLAAPRALYQYEKPEGQVEGRMLDR